MVIACQTVRKNIYGLDEPYENNYVMVKICVLLGTYSGAYSVSKRQDDRVDSGISIMKNCAIFTPN